MSNIEVGEYVRTRDGRIFKVDAEKKNIEINEFMNMRGDKDIVNHDKEPINLVEVGDYVNGEKVHSIIEIFNKEEQVIGRKLTTDYRIAQYNGLHNRYYLYEEDIKSIVTKEQFKAIEYEVE